MSSERVVGRTPEEELARLLVAIRPHRLRDAQRVAGLLDVVDDGKLVEVAQRQRLGRLLAQRLAEQDLPGGPPTVVERLRDGMVQAQLRALALQGVAEMVLSALERGGVPVLPLKGALLSKRLYGDEAIRSSSDIDVLVAPDRIPEAVRICEAMGYRAVPGSGEGPSGLHVALHHEENAFPVVEVHWRVHWYEETFAADMLERRITTPSGFRASPADELACLLLFYQRDGFIGLRLASDIAAWWDHHCDELEDGAIEALATAYPELEPAWRASASVSERVVGLPAARLLRPGRTGRRAGLAARLANWRAAGTPDQLSADTTLIDGLCTPVKQLQAYARRALIIDAARTREYYGLAEQSHALVRVFRVLHPFKVFARYLLALLSIGRRP